MQFSDTFCSAPWFAVRLDWDGNYRPCCEFNEQDSKFTGVKNYSVTTNTVDEWMTSDYSQYLREKLSQGDQIPECNNCWQKEKNQITSLRQVTNNTMVKNKGNDLKNTWVSLYFNKLQDYKNYRLISADIKLSNICNFSCAMCNPHDSSKIYDLWKNDPANPFVEEKLKTNPTYFFDIANTYKTKKGYQHLSDILATPIRYLKVLGGEPLLDKDLFAILENLDPIKKSKISIHFVTNGSQNLLNAANKLKDFYSVSFNVSLDGIGPMQDYIRRGSNWESIEKNIIEAHEQGIKISINYTLQALTIFTLPELLIWAYCYNLPVAVGLLNTPDYLQVSVIPQHIQELAFNKLLEHGAHANEKVKNQIENIKQLIIDCPPNSGLFQKFLNYIEWYESKSTQKLKNLCPEFYIN